MDKAGEFLRYFSSLFDSKFAVRYLVEFEKRFNRCYSLTDLIPRLAYVALRTPPMFEKLLKHGFCW